MTMGFLIPPLNIRKLEVFRCFQGIWKEVSSMKWVKGTKKALLSLKVDCRLCLTQDFWHNANLLEGVFLSVNLFGKAQVTS